MLLVSSVRTPLGPAGLGLCSSLVLCIFFCKVVHIKWLQVWFLFRCHGLEAVLWPDRDVAVPFTLQL